MGLDGVEIVIGVESAFGISITDGEAAECATPRQLIDLVLSKVGRSGDQACLTQRAFHRVRAALMHKLGVPRNQIQPKILLASLIPRPNRKEAVKQICGEIGVKRQIDFVRPAWLTCSAMVTVVFGGLVTCFFMNGHPFESQYSFLNVLLTPLPILAACLFTAISGLFIALATQSMRTEFRPSVGTVGDLSRWIVVNAPDVVQAQPGKWSREQVSATVRDIVLEVLGIMPKDYREDAHFVKDLGVG